MGVRDTKLETLKVLDILIDINSEKHQVRDTNSERHSVRETSSKTNNVKDTCEGHCQWTQAVCMFWTQ